MGVFSSCNFKKFFRFLLVTCIEEPPSLYLDKGVSFCRVFEREIIKIFFRIEGLRTFRKEALHYTWTKGCQNVAFFRKVIKYFLHYVRNKGCRKLTLFWRKMKLFSLCADNLEKNEWRIKKSHPREVGWDHKTHGYTLSFEILF